MPEDIKKIIIVAGEQSGDNLGAGLIRALRQRYPNCHISGIGGVKMMSEGFISYFDMERLSVMGFIDPLKRLPELLRIIRKLKQRFKDDSPDMFIGIDSPDFNIRLESAAKKMGIYSVHYVSPSVWAWRQGRIKKIKKSIDLMLTLFPFEADFYKKNDVDVCFVGHPLADEFPLEPDSIAARGELKLDCNNTLCALMPGSRHFEVESMLPLMLAAAARLKTRFPELTFILPAANNSRLEQINAVISDDQRTYITVISGNSHTAMTAANIVIMASGTTTLEAMLLKRPMVITYRWPKLTWAILSRLVKVDYVGLPNLLAGFEVAPELLQDAATADSIYEHTLHLLENPDAKSSVLKTFEDLHLSLRQNASDTAAEAIVLGWERFHNV